MLSRCAVSTPAIPVSRINALEQGLPTLKACTYEVDHAYDLDPWNPLVHLALAGFEQDPIRANLLRRYSLDRLPNDPKLRQRAAEFLRNQGKEDLAREVEGRGQ